MIELATLSPPEDARYWMLRASELGDSAAMAYCADMLMSHDPVEALACLRRRGPPRKPRANAPPPWRAK